MVLLEAVWTGTKWVMSTSPKTAALLVGGMMLPSLPSIVLYHVPVALFRTSYGLMTFFIDKIPRGEQPFGDLGKPLFVTEDGCHDAVVLHDTLIL